MPEGRRKPVSERNQIDNLGCGSSLFKNSRPIQFAWRNLASIRLSHQCIALGIPAQVLLARELGIGIKIT